MVDSLNTYELAYNTACTYIGQKDYKKAEKLLNTAKSIHNNAFFCCLNYLPLILYFFL
jgi:hypothetical protein